MDSVASRTSFTTFLSHKYKAGSINKFFFGLFNDFADVQFDVDAGETDLNVTRLERMIRGADCFIGVYPFEPVDLAAPSQQQLLDGSRYFRLELDLAARSGKPGLIFTDSRYRNVLSVPAWILREDFNINEIIAEGPKPSSDRFTRSFINLRDRVIARNALKLAEPDFDNAKSQVGILVPKAAGSSAYGPDQIDLLRAQIDDANFEPVDMPWPPVLTPGWIGKVRGFDFVVVDVGAESMATGVVGFLHGAFIPTVRLMKVADASAAEGPPSPLYAGTSVGYRKDIARWSNSDELATEFRRRLASLNLGTRRISTIAEARDYFLEATRRKEPLFISYAGADEELSSPLRAALRERFQQVFDYRDGESIRPGEHWMSTIFEQISLSAIAVPLLSSSYVKSGYCSHELSNLVSLADQGKLHIVPVKLQRGDEFKMPPEIEATQYARLWEYGSIDKLVDWIVKSLPSH